MDILFFLLGALTGGVLVFIFFRSRSKDSEGNDSLVDDLRSQVQGLHEKLQKYEDERLSLNRNLAQLETENTHYREKLHDQKGELEQLQKRFTTEFENLANRLLDEKSRKFTTQNREQITEILKPLGEKIASFEKKVEDTNRDSVERNTALREQIKQLRDLNQQITRDAEALTKALKGDSKAQGNWGEMILEKILERSGLTKDREYTTQDTFTESDGRRLQPDVIIHLPDEKQLIIDSKVSLTAYEQFVNEDGDDAEKHLKSHIQSIRSHMKGLANKNYQEIHGVKGLDFVLLFIPIEPAFALGVQHDESLFQDAYEQNIIIVSPSTLIATLRTISNIWKNEYQNRNAMEIARRAGELYNKFVGFTEDMEQIGRHLGQTQRSYDDAVNKLKTGRGNLIGRAEKVRKLGARTSKQLGAEWQERDDNEDDSE